jgi:competence protein ComEC
VAPFAAGTVGWVGASIAGRRALGTCAALVIASALGSVDAALAAGRLPQWPERYDGRTVLIRGSIRVPPERTIDGWRAVLDVTRVDARDHRGRVRVSGRGQPPSVDLGAVVDVRGRLRVGRPSGNPGERSERDALRRRGLVGVVSVGGAAPRQVQPGRVSLRGALFAVRRRLVEATLRALPEPHDGLLLSLLLGIDLFLPPPVYRMFSQAGLTHLLVVSGAQVAIVAAVVAWGARRAAISIRLAQIVTAIAVCAFVALVDWAPSIGRALMMTLIALLGAYLGRPRDSAATLAAAALVLLAASPPVLFDVGFQLSFAATWGLLYVVPALRRHLYGGESRVAGWIADAVAVTVGAQVAVAPLLMTHFQTLPVAAVLGNLIVVPLIAVVVPVGFALLLAAAALPPVAALLVLLKPGLDAILWTGTYIGGLSWASIAMPPMSPAATVGAVLVLGGGVAACSGALRPTRAGRATMLAGAVLAAALWFVDASAPPSTLVVTAIDVGQGDAYLIRSPGNRAMLIDGGGELNAAQTGRDVGRLRVVPALRRAGVRRLDVVMLSHPHEDHVGGLPAVLENLPVGLVLDPGVPHPSPSYARLLRLVESGRVPYRTARRGQVIDLSAGVRVTILYPPHDPPMVDGDPTHRFCVVARLTHGATSMLFSGDAEAAVERYLLEAGAQVSSQVLKVGHHGSRTSTTPEFVGRVRPHVAVISVGAGNTFAHPHRVTLDTLAAARVDVYRTDLHGAVTLSSDGTAWSVASWRDAAGARVH